MQKNPRLQALKERLTHLVEDRQQARRRLRQAQQELAKLDKQIEQVKMQISNITGK